MVRVHTLWLTTGPPTHNEQVMLQLQPNEHVIRAARLRRDDGIPLVYELVSIPAALVPKYHNATSLPDIQPLASAANLKLGRATETRSQVAADQLIAKHLNVALGSAIDMLDRLVLTDGGRPVEWRIAFTRP